MLEHYANQASGLLGMGIQDGPRLLAVVSHGDEQAELPLLWQLCLALVNFGYTVTVLDATIHESETNPGLAQLLDSAHWRDTTTRDTPAWTVLPAGQGIQRLCSAESPHIHSVQQLGHLFPNDSVVVLYCRVEWMIPLIAESSIEPLLAVSQIKTSLMTSYLALKRLLITGKLRPTIINMVPDRVADPTPTGLPISASLGECARRFLGHEVKSVEITERLGDDGQCSNVQRLALRLMENALTLGRDSKTRAVGARVRPFENVDHFAGSH